jgi:hypothetical protein
MVLYLCDKCKKVFNKKSNYLKHLTSKKYPCTGNTEKAEHIEDKLEEKLENKPENKSENKPENKKYKCSYCNLECVRLDSLQRHIKKFCKNKKHLDEIDVIKSKFTNNLTVTNNKHNQIVTDNLKLVEMLEEYKEFIKEGNLLKQAIPLVNVLSSNLSSNSNNKAINNGNINNTNVQVTINGFGKEDLKKYNLVEMMSVYLKSTGGNIFSNMLKFINFNPSFPENFNILMSDLARENVKIYNGKKFVTKKFKNVKTDILNVLSSHICSMCDDYIDDPNTKKSEDILNKMKINDISVKLINNDDITPLLIKNKSNDNDSEQKTDVEGENDTEGELDAEGEKKLIHYESKRQGLQEITIEKLKDELYNNRGLVLGR